MRGGMTMALVKRLLCGGWKNKRELSLFLLLFLLGLLASCMPANIIMTEEMRRALEGKKKIDILAYVETNTDNYTDNFFQKAVTGVTENLFNLAKEKPYDIVITPKMEYFKVDVLDEECDKKISDRDFAACSGSYKVSLKVSMKIYDSRKNLILVIDKSDSIITERYVAYASSYGFDGNRRVALERSQSYAAGSANQQFLNKIMPSIIDSIYNSNGIRRIEETILAAKIEYAQKRALPSDLALNISSDSFYDTGGFLPNKTLDAGEDAEVTVKITNTGRGSGYGTILEITSDNLKIAFDKQITIGDIQPNETKEIKIPLKASLELSDGKTAFTFDLKEKRGYDAKKVAMYVPTARLEKPELEIVNTEINDGDTGLAKGNGNGVIESGETIELTAFIKNNGVGRAIGVNLSGLDVTTGIQWVRDSTLVGTVPPDEIVKAKVAFTVPRNFDAKDVAANLKATDSRGVSNVEKKFAMSFAKRSPNLQYAYRIYSKGAQVSAITNGGDYEIELDLKNSGQIAAKNVTVSLSSDRNVSLSRSRIDIGDVKEQASIPGQRVAFTVPRTYVETKVSLNITIAQSDFASLNNDIQIPVEVNSPKLRYVANVQGGGNSIEKGASTVLEVNVSNDGNLPAEGVRIKVESRDKEALNVGGKSEETIGKIPADSKSETIKFQLSTKRGKIKLGENYLDINITQNDFQPVHSQYALNVVEEGMAVVDIGAEDKQRTQTAKVQSGGPLITLKSPQHSETTTEDTTRLAFDVSGSRNIDSIKVTVNGNVELDEKPASAKKGIVKEIKLQEGQNKIAIIAYNIDNIPSRKEIIVTRSSDDDVDNPIVTAVRNPEAVAVVIGISKYKNNKEMPPVDYAKRDAQTVRKYLVSTLGYDEKRIIELYDEDADRTSLVSALYDDLRNRIVPGKSDVFIFYSGHGMPDVDSKEAEKDAYLAPYDFRSSATKRTGIALNELYEQVEKFNAQSVTIVMDSCFSGITEKGSLITGISAVIEVSNPMLRAKKGILFTASSSKEAARWYDKKQHGLFTYYFLLGLKGKADANGDGQITKKELEDFVRRNVAEQSQYRQNPTAMGSLDAVMVKLK